MKTNMHLNISFFTPGHYCVGGVALPCPAGTYGPIKGLQRLRDCTICPAGRVADLLPYFSIMTYSHPKDCNSCKI